MRYTAIWLLLGCLAAPVSATGLPQVVLETSQGEIELTLDSDKAPESAANFLRYVDAGYYDGTIFHRVISGFMVQGGGLTPDMRRKEAESPVRNESANGLRNQRGTVAMARTQDPHSATSQFFINLVDNAFLDRANAADGWGYTVFGRVTAGMDVVDSIARTPTTIRARRRDVPETPIIIQRATRKAGTETPNGESK